MVELLPSMWEALGSVTCTRNLDMSAHWLTRTFLLEVTP